MNNKELAFSIAKIINTKFPQINVYYNEFDDPNEIFIIIDDRKIYVSKEYIKLVSEISSKYNKQKNIFFSALFPEEKPLNSYINLTKDIVSDKYIQNDISLSTLHLKEKSLNTGISLTKDIKYGNAVKLQKYNRVEDKDLQSISASNKITKDTIYVGVQHDINSVTTLIQNNNIGNITIISKQYNNKYSDLKEFLNGDNIWLNNKAA